VVWYSPETGGPGILNCAGVEPSLARRVIRAAAAASAVKVTPAPPSGNWCLQILKTKDNLVGAIEFLRTTYIDELAGRPVKGPMRYWPRLNPFCKMTNYTCLHSCCCPQDF
jgi:hypothetical protein